MECANKSYKKIMHLPANQDYWVGGWSILRTYTAKGKKKPITWFTFDRANPMISDNPVEYSCLIETQSIIERITS